MYTAEVRYDLKKLDSHEWPGITSEMLDLSGEQITIMTKTRRTARGEVITLHCESGWTWLPKWLTNYILET